MPPFFVFAGLDYYPGGGWEDFIGYAADLHRALAIAANHHHHDWWHIVDAETMKIVEEGDVQ